MTASLLLPTTTLASSIRPGSVSHKTLNQRARQPNCLIDEKWEPCDIIIDDAGVKGPAGHITNGEHRWLIQQAQLSVDRQPSSGHRGSWRDVGKIRTAACGPNQTVMSERVAAVELNAGWGHGCHRRLQVHRHIATLQGRGRTLAIEGRAVRQDCCAPFNQMQAGAAFQQISQFAGQFHAGGTCSHNDERRIVEALLAEFANQTLQLMNVIKVLKTEGVVFDSWDAEIIRTGSRGHQQLLPVELMSGCGADGLRARVDRHHPILNPADAPIAEQICIGGGNFPCLELSAE